MVHGFYFTKLVFCQYYFVCISNASILYLLQCQVPMLEVCSAQNLIDSDVTYSRSADRPMRAKSQKRIERQRRRSSSRAEEKVMAI